jgi:tubulin beta
MGIKFWEVVCDENGIGGGGEYCGNNDAQLGRISVFYHEASGGKHAPRAVLFDLEPSLMGAVRASPIGELGHEQQLSQGPLHRGLARILTNPL